LFHSIPRLRWRAARIMESIKALELSLPQSLVARAHEVIE
jgi:hypothetical protein